VSTRNYFNRELSWLEFNARVLSEAEDSTVPLLERAKFLSIFASNLDEFFMVRVAGLWRMVQEQFQVLDSPDNLTSSQALGMIKKRVEDLQARCSACAEKVWRELEQNNISLKKFADLSKEQQDYLSLYFSEQISPVLTPLSVDPAHPFPYLSNLRPYLVAVFDTSQENIPSDEPIYSLIEIPSLLPRLIPLVESPDSTQYILIEDVIRQYLDQILVGFPIKQVFQVRVTRNFDYNLLESEVVDLLKSVHTEINKKWEQEVVRLEVSTNFPDDILTVFKSALEIADEDIYRIAGPMDMATLSSISRLDRPVLRDPPFNPRLPARLAESNDIFSVIAEGDLMVHHPYDSFYAVTRFLYAAATDPDVLAIKQTLYRTSGDSPIVDALLTAAENGKQVVAVIELKARFDERANIVWARRLERAGVNVVFGFVGYKTHAKAALVVRREKGKVVRYVHLATGNYNSTTARLYTDIGVFTCDREITTDISNLFNFLTGYNILAGEKRLVQSRYPTHFSAISLAPFKIRESFISLIDDEIKHHRAGKEGRIIAKMNALTDKEIIDKLYEASQAGVKISLIVRGMCCLVPGQAGLSENIEVISLLDRFLEHSRIYYFRAGGEERVFLSSADWMPRNFDRRIEIAWPLRSKALVRQVIDEIFPAYLQDNTKAWRLLPDGTYLKAQAVGVTVVRAQQIFIEMAREEGVKSIPYETAIRQKKTTDSPVAKERSARKKSKNSPPLKPGPREPGD
jgi:polyphosphate kinase